MPQKWLLNNQLKAYAGQKYDNLYKKNISTSSYFPNKRQKHVWVYFENAIQFISNNQLIYQDQTKDNNQLKQAHFMII